MSLILLGILGFPLAYQFRIMRSYTTMIFPLIALFLHGPIIGQNLSLQNQFERLENEHVYNISKVDGGGYVTVSAASIIYRKGKSSDLIVRKYDQDFKVQSKKVLPDFIDEMSRLRFLSEADGKLYFLYDKADPYKVRAIKSRTGTLALISIDPAGNFESKPLLTMKWNDFWLWDRNLFVLNGYLGISTRHGISSNGKYIGVVVRVEKTEFKAFLCDTDLNLVFAKDIELGEGEKKVSYNMNGFLHVDNNGSLIIPVAEYGEKIQAQLIKVTQKETSNLTISVKDGYRPEVVSLVSQHGSLLALVGWEARKPQTTPRVIFDLYQVNGEEIDLKDSQQHETLSLNGTNTFTTTGFQDKRLFQLDGENWGFFLTSTVIGDHSGAHLNMFYLEFNGQEIIHSKVIARRRSKGGSIKNKSMLAQTETGIAIPYKFEGKTYVLFESREKREGAISGGTNKQNLYQMDIETETLELIENMDYRDLDLSVFKRWEGGFIFGEYGLESYMFHKLTLE